MKILFVDFSSAFITIIPDTLQNKLTQISIPTSICQWINSFLTDRQQLVRLGKLSSSTRTISTGALQGCFLSPLLFSFSTQMTAHLKTLIQDSDESAYRQEVKELAVWCSYNNLELNTLKTVEMVVDFRRNSPALPSLTIMNNTVTAVESFRFLGTTISQDPKWDIHIDIEPQAHSTQFYSAFIESVLCSSITVWFGSASKSDIRRVQWTVRTAERIIGVYLPSLQDLYCSRVKKRAGNIITDPSHPGHNLFALLPSGKRYRSLCTRTSRYKNVNTFAYFLYICIQVHLNKFKCCGKVHLFQ